MSLWFDCSFIYNVDAQFLKLQKKEILKCEFYKQIFKELIMFFEMDW